MYGTGDWRVTDAANVDGEWYDQVVQAEYELNPAEEEYILEADRIGLSTRSTLARNLTDIRQAKNTQYTVSDGTISGEFVVKHYRTPVNIGEGDKVLRLIAYDEEDQLDGEQVETIISEQPGTATDGYWELPLDGTVQVTEDRPDPVPFAELDKDKNRYLDFDDGVSANSTHADQREQLYTTPTVEMPEGVWGIIKGVQNAGYGEHLFSPAVDPEFARELVIEINRMYDLPPITWPKEGAVKLELYCDTEFSEA